MQNQATMITMVMYLHKLLTQYNLIDGSMPVFDILKDRVF